MATKERVSVSTEKEAKTGTRVCHCRALKMRAVVILSSEFGVFGREGVQKNAASLSLSLSLAEPSLALAVGQYSSPLFATATVWVFSAWV